MFKLKKLSRNTIAVTTAILMMNSTITLPFVNAENPEATIAYSGDFNSETNPLSQFDADTKVLTTTETNLLANKPMVMDRYDAGAAKAIFMDGTQSTLTDGKVQGNGFGVYLSGDVATRYVDFTYNLKGSATLQNFALFNDGQAELSTYKYELYVADTLANLDTASPLVTYTNTDSKSCQIFNIAGVTSANYFRLRVLSENATNDNCIRMWEVALYGSNYVPSSGSVVTYSGNRDNQDVPLTMTDASHRFTTSKTNFLVGKPMTVQPYDSNGPAGYYYEGNIATITDGIAWDNGFGIGYAMGAGKTGRYLDLTFQLNGSATLENFALFNNQGVEYGTNKYELYASDTLENLNLSTPIITYTDSTSHPCQIIDLEGVTNAKFFRIGILTDSIANDQYARIWEIALYGSNYVENSETTLAHSGGRDNSNVPLSMTQGWPPMLVTTKTNLLAGKPLNIIGYDANGKTAAPFVDGTLSNIFDGNTWDSGFGVQYYGAPASRYLDFTFILNGTAKLDNFALWNHGDPRYANQKYAIYAADTIENLDTASPLITFTNTAGDQCQIFSILGVQNAKYFRLRILKETNGMDDYARIWEIALYGSLVEDQIQVAYTGDYNSATNPLSQFDATKMLTTTQPNLLVNKPLIMQAYDQTGPKAIGYDLSPTLMTDGSAADGFYIYNSGDYNSKYLNMTFDLEGTSTIQNFVMFNNSDKTIATNKYALYASNTLEGLDSPSALITFTNTSNDRCQIFSFTGITAKYFRVRLLVDNTRYRDCFRINEMALYGSFTAGTKCAYTGDMNNSSFPLSEVNSSDNTLATTKTNLLFGKAMTIQANDINGPSSSYNLGNIGTFVDGKAQDTDGVGVEVGGDAATRYLDLTFNLEASFTLENFAMFSVNNSGLRTYKYSLYAADSLANLDTVDPFASFVNTTTKQCQIFDIPNVTGAKYFRIRVINNNYNGDPYVRINEAALYGSVVPPVSFGSHIITGNTITNIAVGSTVEQFLVGVQVNIGTTLEFKNLATGNKIRTGTTIEVTTSGVLTDTYTLVIYGDVDGNGDIDLGDLIKIRNCLLETEELSGEFLKASNLYGEQGITLNVLVGIMAYVSESGTINQNK